MQPELKFHSIHGKNITLQRDGRRAVLRIHTFDEVVFSNRPISINEEVCIRLSVDGANVWQNGLKVGVTNIDPASMAHHFNFGNPSVMELLRCYNSFRVDERIWIGELYRGFVSLGGLAQFSVTQRGAITYSINGEDKGIFIRRIDTARPLWIVFALRGTDTIEFVTSPVARATQQVAANVPQDYPVASAAGPVAPLATPAMAREVRPNPQNYSVAPSASPVAPLATVRVPNVVQPQSSWPTSGEKDNECSICMNAEVNTAFIACGHMFICYECAVRIKTSGAGCPVCREPIRDVLKIYKL